MDRDPAGRLIKNRPGMPVSPAVRYAKARLVGEPALKRKRSLFGGDRSSLSPPQRPAGVDGDDGRRNRQGCADQEGPVMADA